MKRFLVALLLLGLIISTNAGIAYAVDEAPPDLPMIVYGTVFISDNGVSAPVGAGAVVRALLGGTTVGQATTDASGAYTLLVGAAQRITNGMNISFTVDNKSTGVTMPFTSGGTPVHRDLTVGTPGGGGNEPPDEYEPPTQNPGELTVDGPKMQGGLAGVDGNGPVGFTMQGGLDQYRADFTDDALNLAAGGGHDVILGTGDVTVTFGPDMFLDGSLLAVTDLTSQPQDYLIRIIITKLTGSEISALGADAPGQGLAGTTVRMGNAVYRVQILLVIGQQIYPITAPPKPVTISVTFAGTGMNPNRVGLYVLDEASDTWDLLGGRVDKERQTVSFRCDHMGVFGVFETVRRFSDLTGHWAEGDIQTMYARGIVTGMTETTFVPDAAVTRAQFISMLARILQLRAQPGVTLPFSDIPSGAWFASDLAAAYQAGLVSGVEAGLFGPDALLTREQAVVMIVRALAYLGQDVSVTPADRAALSAYPDSAEVHDWALDAMAYAVKHGLIRGRDGLLAPGAEATRAEAAVLLNRLFQ